MKKLSYRKAILSTAAFCLCSLSAQPPAVLQSIEANNTTLKALRAAADEQKLDNQTALWLANTEVAFNYLWGSPRIIGDRKDFAVTQSLDYPTLSGLKSRVAENKKLLAELEYASERLNILLEARLCCTDLIYCNLRINELASRLRHASDMEEAYRKKLDSGDANILEYNKININKAVMEGELKQAQIERNALLIDLKRLNGDNELQFNDVVYPDFALPLDFDSWYAQAEQNSPLLKYVKQEIQLKKQEVSISRAKSMPVIKAGYMSEKVVGQHYQGVSIGVALPLWENKNNIKRAKAAVNAAEQRHYDAHLQFYAHLQSLFSQALGYSELAQTYSNATNANNHNSLLLKAFNSGAISLLEYLLALEQNYELTDKSLQTQHNYYRTLAHLQNQFETFAGYDLR